jgi:hypothetical protein
METDKLLNTEYWIIDILPKRVPKDSPGQYFAVEKHFLSEEIDSIKKKHINLILKLNCYREISIEGEADPDPAKTADIMKDRYVYIMTGDSMILSEPDDTHMTLFNPDYELLELVKLIASGEGLFVWRGNEQ